MINVLAPALKAETGIELRIDQVPYEDIRAKNWLMQLGQNDMILSIPVQNGHLSMLSLQVLSLNMW